MLPVRPFTSGKHRGAANGLDALFRPQFGLTLGVVEGFANRLERVAFSHRPDRGFRACSHTV